MKKILLFLLAISMPFFLLASEPVREWKSKSGKTIAEATLDVEKIADPNTVYLLKDGKRYKVPLDKLSLADQEYVNEVRQGSRSLDDEIELEEDIDDDGMRGMAVVPSGNQYALLIGVNNYLSPIKSLKYCVNDMKYLAECFRKIGLPSENVILVTDPLPYEKRPVLDGNRPTGSNIRRQIENITSIMEPGDQLIIAFSGHGVLIDGKSYLCPGDTNLDDLNSIIPREWVYEKLANCKARQKVFIIDACRNEISTGMKSLGQAKTLEDPIGADTHGFILLASCDKKQQSWEHTDIQHGVFSYFLAEGLSGAAADEDGYVTILGLAHYTTTKTKKFVYNKLHTVQLPTYSMGGKEDGMSDFCLAKFNVASSAHTGGHVVSSTPTPAPAPTAIPDLTLKLPSGSKLKPGHRHCFVINGTEFAFRWCPDGSFTMGSPQSEAERDDDELQHKVTLTQGFWIMETEVTQKQWKAIMGENNNPSWFKGDSLPVENISWNDCQAFCKKCAGFGLPLLLPTEAQWEYACRAGSTQTFFWGNTLNGDKASCDGTYFYGNTTKGTELKMTKPVKSFEPNAWGLFDMHGNVSEWCSDYYSKEYPSNNITNPVGPPTGSIRVYRGGSWDGFAKNCRSANRYSGGMRHRERSLGARFVIDLN